MRNNYNYSKNNRCIDCRKLITNYSKRCCLCNIKYFWVLGILNNKQSHFCSKETKIKIGLKNKEKYKGKNNPNYRKFGKLNPCQYQSKKTKLKISEASKLHWQNSEFRNKILKASMLGRLIKPNKPEKLLSKLLGKDYKFVGDGKVILNGFCPDFINCNGQKKIIEFFGDYWHRNTQEKDKRKLQTYKRYGYKTLVIWEKELKDLDKVKNKILEFNKK